MRLKETQLCCFRNFVSFASWREFFSRKAAKNVKILAAPLLIVLFCFGCQNNILQPANTALPTMRDVPSVRLNYKYEADVPVPSIDASKTVSDERNAAVQSDFDANRPLELLDRTLFSPDKKKVLAVYHRLSDPQDAEGLDVYRLDMYSADGSLMKKLTSETMAVYFPETIVWSPDSNSLAFVAKTRAVQAEPDMPFPTSTDDTAANSQLESNSDMAANSTIGSVRSSPSPASPYRHSNIQDPTNLCLQCGWQRLKSSNGERRADLFLLRLVARQLDAGGAGDDGA